MKASTLFTNMGILLTPVAAFTLYYTIDGLGQYAGAPTLVAAVPFLSIAIVSLAIGVLLARMYPQSLDRRAVRHSVLAVWMGGAAMLAVVGSEWYSGRDAPSWRYGSIIGFLFASVIVSARITWTKEGTRWQPVARIVGAGIGAFLLTIVTSFLWMVTFIPAQ